MLKISSRFLYFWILLPIYFSFAFVFNLPISPFGNFLFFKIFFLFVVSHITFIIAVKSAVHFLRKANFSIFWVLLFLTATFLCLIALNLFRLERGDVYFYMLCVSISLYAPLQAGRNKNNILIVLPIFFLYCVLASVLSFAIRENGFEWQAVVFSLGLSFMALSCEWFVLVKEGKISHRMFPIVLVLGPLVIGTLAILQHLPWTYLSVFLVLPFAATIGEKTKKGKALEREIFSYFWLITVILVCVRLI